MNLQRCPPALARAILDGDLSGVAAGRGWPHADTLDALRLPDTFLVVHEGQVVGDCGWFGPPDDDGEVEIGYGLAAPFRGGGLGGAMVSALLAWVRTQPGVTRVVADTEAGNVPSRRVLERLGFVVDDMRGASVRYALDLAGGTK